MGAQEESARSLENGPGVGERGGMGAGQGHVERLRTLGEIAVGMAHNLNNVLTQVTGNAEILLGCEQWNPETREALQRIVQAAQDGARMVQRVQDFARLRQRAETETVDLHAVARDVIALLEPRWKAGAQRAGIEIVVRLMAGACPPVQGNAGELREALTNVVLNALDAMPRGGALTITTGVQAGHALLHVRDSGVGMSEEVRRRALEPFYTTKAERGTGLGLSTANSIITRHGGHLEIESSLGRGTTISILLPATEVEEPAPPPREATVRAPCRALVVDDEERVAQVLARFLRLDKHEVTLAVGGEAGLQALEEVAARGAAFDVIFTDLSMGAVNGQEVARRARALFPGARVVLVTGWGEGVQPQLEEHVDAVLSKPFGLNTVRLALIP